MIIFGIPKRNNLKETTFQAAYEKYYPLIFKQLYYLLGNNGAAEDVAQETFIRYYEAKHYEIDYLGPWLSKVATHLAYNYIRGEKRRTLREENILKEINEIFSSEEAILRKEEILRVRKTLKQLNENQRICLILKFSGYSYDEIYQITTIPKNNISQHIARGKQKFEELHQKEGENHVLRYGTATAGY